MESLLQCPSCGARTRAGDDWCGMCFARLVLPAASVRSPEQGLGTPLVREQRELPERQEPWDEQEPWDQQEPREQVAAGSRRALRAEHALLARTELDRLAETMLGELAATQTRVALPGPMERVFRSIGLADRDNKARRGVGIAVLCGAVVAVLVTVSAVAGLVL